MTPKMTHSMQVTFTTCPPLGVSNPATLPAAVLHDPQNLPHSRSLTHQGIPTPRRKVMGNAIPLVDTQPRIGVIITPDTECLKKEPVAVFRA